MDPKAELLPLTVLGPVRTDTAPDVPGARRGAKDLG